MVSVRPFSTSLFETNAFAAIRKNCLNVFLIDVIFLEKLYADQ